MRKTFKFDRMGRGGRGDDSCHGGIINGGLWWPEEEAFKTVGAYVAATATVAFASPENVAWLLLWGEVHGGDKGGIEWSRHHHYGERRGSARLVLEREHLQTEREGENRWPLLSKGERERAVKPRGKERELMPRKKTKSWSVLCPIFRRCYVEFLLCKSPSLSCVKLVVLCSFFSFLLFLPSRFPVFCQKFSPFPLLLHAGFCGFL